jgi:hypothetical protein
LRVARHAVEPRGSPLSCRRLTRSARSSTLTTP